MIDALLKFLHILGVVLMVGNVITTGLWAHWAVSEDKEALRRYAAHSILKADIFLTFLGGGLIVVTGIIMSVANDTPMTTTPWIVQELNRPYSIYGMDSVLIPDQLRMQKHAEAEDKEAFVKAYKRAGISSAGLPPSLCFTQSGLWWLNKIWAHAEASARRRSDSISQVERKRSMISSDGQSQMRSGGWWPEHA
ncbi:MAG: DUF2269 family protein [Cyanobacteriota/Melainabacteria group bacterium]